MSSIWCQVGILLSYVLRLYWLCMLIYAVVSWVPSMQGRWTYYLARIVEPVLAPVRRIIPPMGGFDLAFLVVILLVSWLINAVPQSACSIAY